MIWVQQISRSNFHLLWFSYSLAFGCYVWLVFGKKSITLRLGLSLALIARLVSFFFDPLLSDDYFRFIWDGMLINEGIHPMAYTPDFLATHPNIISIQQGLYEALNSKPYYSVYPPVAQWLFGLSYYVCGPNLIANVICYKGILLAADMAIVYLLYKLLIKRNLSADRVLIFALNPLIILEFMGNLHMDGIMIASLLWAIILTEEKSLLGSVGAMAFSILSKFLTVMLLPFMPKHLYWKKISIFSILTVVISLIILWFSFGIHTGWLKSINLWFQSFEFNASVYYLVRSLGYLLKGYNTIAILGPAMAVGFLFGALVIWTKYLRTASLDWASAMLFLLTLFFLFSTTIHPWYIGILLVLSVLSKHSYPVVWTYLIVLSYSHYDAGGYSENYWLIATEYLLLGAFMLWEWKCKKATKRIV